ncbi:MAG TPA: LacI family DNA-binding transcriptional regulator [Kineosporiaceae bacterium]|nr:LacI family DNA-binding transcriptional regulator [Kineosporiaceae bacterium]
MQQPQVERGAAPPIAPNPRRPTMKDVADAAGVSKALVSMIFRDAPGPSAETRARVFEVAERIGYRTNRTASLLARRRTNLLGVTMSVRSPFHAELVDDLQAVADEVGYEVVLSTVTRTHDERRAIDTLLEFRCEALVLLGPDLPAAELETLAGQIPVVCVGRRLESPLLDVVRTADDEGLRQVVDHLVELGHHRIVHAGEGASEIGAARQQGYRAAMGRHGLDALIATVAGGSTEADGLRAATDLLARPRLPTAIAAFNDRCAVGLLDGLDRAGIRVPQDVSVVGYDDSLIARLRRIDLTSVSQEAGAQARLAVSAAIERLDGDRTAPSRAVLTPRLVVRGSTAPPPAG